MRLVTVGTGMAATEFVATARRLGFRGEVVMCGAEPFAPYSPCVMPFFLAGEPIETIYWKGIDFYERHGVTARLGDRVVEVDRDARLVRTVAGRTEAFDALFYATGDRTWWPDPAWASAQGVFGFTSLTDIRAIDSYIRENGITDAVVAGGGFIGVDAALALRVRGLDVAIVHRNTRLLSQMTDQEGGAFATDRLRRKMAFDVRLRTEVAGISAAAGRLTGVRLTNGDEIATRLLIVAIGVTPNSTPLTGATDGVAVDAGLLAGEGIFAAGDVAVTQHLVTGAWGRYATYLNATAQARVAAERFVLGTGAYAGSVNTNVLKKHIDFPVVSAGTLDGEAITWQRGDVWRRVYLRDGSINGYLIVGDTRLSGYLFHQYVSRTRVNGYMRRILTTPGIDGYYRVALGLT